MEQKVKCRMHGKIKDSCEVCQVEREHKEYGYYLMIQEK